MRRDLHPGWWDAPFPCPAARLSFRANTPEEEVWMAAIRDLVEAWPPDVPWREERWRAWHDGVADVLPAMIPDWAPLEDYAAALLALRDGFSWCYSCGGRIDAYALGMEDAL